MGKDGENRASTWVQFATLILPAGSPFLPLLIPVIVLKCRFFFFAKVLRAEDSLIVFCPLQLWFLICFRLLNYCTLSSSATCKNARLPDSLPTLSQKAPNTCNVFIFQKCFEKNHGSFPFTNASVCQLHFISYRRFLSASFRPQI